MVEEEEQKRREDAERLAGEEEERKRREEDAAVAERQKEEEERTRKEEAAARNAHAEAADRAMTLVKERLAEQDLDGAQAARATAAREWESAGEDAEMWLMALDRNISALAGQLEDAAAAEEAAAAARMEQQQCEEGLVAVVAPVVASAENAAFLEQALGGEKSALSEADGAQASSQWPSLSISEGDSGAPISSDSDDEGDDEAGVGGSIMRSCLDKSVMGEDMLGACAQEPLPPLVSSDDAASAPARAPLWAEEGMFKVEQLAAAQAGAPVSLHDFARAHPAAMGMQGLPDAAPMTSISHTTSASFSVEHDPLPVRRML